MLVKTKHFGEIDLAPDKVITFEKGIFGFEEYKKYTILFNSENKETVVSWLQSLDEPSLALPIINPFLVKPDYNPNVSEQTLKELGELNDENTVVYTTLTVPSEVEKMTANLKAPIIINADTKKGYQVVAENEEYAVKYSVYEKLKKK